MPILLLTFRQEAKLVGIWFLEAECKLLHTWAGSADALGVNLYFFWAPLLNSFHVKQVLGSTSSLQTLLRSAWDSGVNTWTISVITSVLFSCLQRHPPKVSWSCYFLITLRMTNPAMEEPPLNIHVVTNL